MFHLVCMPLLHPHRAYPRAHRLSNMSAGKHETCRRSSAVEGIRGLETHRYAHEVPPSERVVAGGVGDTGAIGGIAGIIRIARGERWIGIEEVVDAAAQPERIRE